MVLRFFGVATSRWTVVVNDCQWVFEMNQMQLNGSVVSRSTPRTVDCAPKDVVKRRYGVSLCLQHLPSVTFTRYVDTICQMPIITKFAEIHKRQGRSHHHQITEDTTGIYLVLPALKPHKCVITSRMCLQDR